ncbi:MAG TPA: hypothetical protein PLE19_13095 [Planctomycetota bacterium]|nr:hypothetical protein [Planctomycetota bacterium]HRR81116.1 hypothetical protein [Planctomycetota bacterium]HRT96549.1 hypothetical protein [Planctomycetota bacterium]
MQLTIWRHIRLELPADWEMLQFSRNAAAGRCAFADRRQFRAELSWQTVSEPPDLERLASNYLAKQRLEGTMPDAASVRTGEWHGLRGLEEGLLTSRFSRYLAEEGCLIEVALLWPDGLDPSLEARVLDSVGSEPPWPGGRRRWRALGIDAFASPSLDLVECIAQPALARLEFADAKEARHVTFERLGMVPQWLRGSVRDWLMWQMPADVQAPVVQASCLCAPQMQRLRHQVETIGGLRRGGLFRRPAHYAAAAWLCPADGRLYRVAVTGPEAGESGQFISDRLSCCEGKPLRG